MVSGHQWNAVNDTGCGDEFVRRVVNEIQLRRDTRYLNGYGSHTYSFINDKDERYWVKFYLTKVWPYGDYSLIDVGVLELNSNPENYFAEVEQSAFSPANVVPGISHSPDKVLQFRIVSYADAHRYWLGVNYENLPVNSFKTRGIKATSAPLRTHWLGESVQETASGIRSRCISRRGASTEGARLSTSPPVVARAFQPALDIGEEFGGCLGYEARN